MFKSEAPKLTPKVVLYGEYKYFGADKFNLQSFTKYLKQALVFVWDNALREGLGVCCSWEFY